MADTTISDVFFRNEKMPETSDGERPSPDRETAFGSAGCMFDRLTGLPSFHLFEDRLQTALTGELLKDIRMRRFQIAVIGVFVRDLPQTGDEAVQKQILRRVADMLQQALPKNYTVARGINYHFWIMVPNIGGSAEIGIETEKIAALLSQPLIVGSHGYRLAYNIGVSVFDGDAVSQATLVGQAIAALQKAIDSGENRIVYFAELVP